MGVFCDALQYRTTDLALTFAVHNADVVKSRDKGGIQVLIQLDQGLLDPHLSEVDFQGRGVQSPNQKGSPAARLALTLSLAPAYGFNTGCSAGEASVGLGEFQGGTHGLVGGA